MAEVELTKEDILAMAARSGPFFASTFLPKDFPLAVPEFHSEIWQTIEDPENRYVSIEVFRDGAKTTLTRAFVLKSICFATCSVVVFTSESQKHARLSLEWMARRIKQKDSTRLTVGKFFGLSVGALDNRDELEIKNALFGTTVRIIGLGADSQVRGVNVDGDRPDLIVADDYLPAEILSQATLDFYVTKFFGALENALASRTMNPYAKLINLGTKSDKNDILGMCEVDPRYVCKKFSILTESGESAWPAKWSTKDLMLEKEAAAAKNMLSVWLREKECKLVKSETTIFKDSWLSLYDEEDDGWIYFLGVDPVPPPSAKQIAEGLRKKDWEVWSVVGYKDGRFRLCEQTQNKGHDILWTLDEAFHMMRKYKPKAIGVEAIAYQRTIAYQLRERMKQEREYTQVIEVTDQRSKLHKIADTLSPLAQIGALEIHRSCSSFQTQFAEYPGVEHDDHLDSAQIAINAAKTYLGGRFIQDSSQGQEQSEYDIEYEKVTKSGGLALCP